MPRRLATSDEAGWALIELLVGAAMMVGVLGAILSILEATQRVSIADQERAAQIRDAETGVYAMTRELRETYSVVAIAPYSFEGNMYERGRTLHVKYDCSGASSINPSWGQCVRSVVGGQSQVVIPAFTNTSASGGRPVFSYVTNGAGTVTYVAVHLEVPAQGRLRQGDNYRITYDDGAYMRNLG